MLSGYEIIDKTSHGAVLFDTHLHNEFEINFMLSDNVEVIIENKMFTSKKGDVFIFPPYTFHKIDSKGNPFSRYVLFFNEAAVLDACCALAPIIDTLKNTDCFAVSTNEKKRMVLIELFDTACHEFHSKTYSSDFRNITAFGNILNHLISIAEKTGSSGAPLAKNHEILNVLSYINTNFEKPLTIDSIARRFGMSSTTLWHMMKNTIRLSPKEYLLKIRIAKATQFLANGMSVTETAEKTGFNSYAHFIRTFTKHIGTSPYKFGKSNHQ